MSEKWKVGDKAYVPVEFVDRSKGSSVCRFKTVGGGVVLYFADDDVDVMIRSIPPSSPSPVDVSQIKVGDEVTVRGKVLRDSSGSDGIVVVFDGDDNSFVPQCCVASHTPSRPPSTLAEFDTLTPEQRTRWWAEMVKGKVGA